MAELMVTALTLGLAGIDPTGLFIALGVLAAGGRERSVVAFAFITVIGTAVFGTVLSLTLGHQLQTFDWSVLRPPDWLATLLESLIAAALLLWAWVRLRRPEARPPRPDARSRPGNLLVWLGLAFAVSAVLDPTFLGLVVLAGREQSVAVVSTAHLVWILLSQLPLVVLAVAVLLGRHARLVTWMQDVMPRARPVVARAVTVLLALVGLLLALDSGWWWVSGHWLVADPG